MAKMVMMSMETLRDMLHGAALSGMEHGMTDSVTQDIKDSYDIAATEIYYAHGNVMEVEG